MNIMKHIDQYKEKYVYFCEPIKNNIMNEANFIRFIYSTPHVMLNGIYLLLPLQYTCIERYYNKYKCVFPPTSENIDMVEKMRVIEMNLLKRVSIQNKMPVLKINEQLSQHFLKVFPTACDTGTGTGTGTGGRIQSEPVSHVFLVKISGIWETDKHFGLTYKFSKLQGMVTPANVTSLSVSCKIQEVAVHGSECDET